MARRGQPIIGTCESPRHYTQWPCHFPFFCDNFLVTAVLPSAAALTIRHSARRSFGGAGNTVLNDATRHFADAIVTAEAKMNPVIAQRRKGSRDICLG